MSDDEIIVANINMDSDPNYNDNSDESESDVQLPGWIQSQGHESVSFNDGSKVALHCGRW